MNVIPTLLTTSKEEFIKQMDIFQPLYSRIQLDITDGNLVPNITTQTDEIIELMELHKVRISPEVSFDFHLMVKDYEKELANIDTLQSLGMKVDTALLNAGLHPDIPTLNHQYDFSLGLDIFPEVTVDEVASHFDIDILPVIQVMTVNPGFQGSPFLEPMLKKIEQLKKQNYKGIMMIDGGVNEATLPIIASKDYKPDYLCIGSYLTKAEDLLERVEHLRSM